MKRTRPQPKAELLILGGPRPRTIRISASTDSRDIRRQLRPGERISGGEEILAA